MVVKGSWSVHEVTWKGTGYFRDCSIYHQECPCDSVFVFSLCCFQANSSCNKMKREKVARTDTVSKGSLDICLSCLVLSPLCEIKREIILWGSSTRDINIYSLRWIFYSSRITNRSSSREQNNFPTPILELEMAGELSITFLYLCFRLILCML